MAGETEHNTHKTDEDVPEQADERDITITR